jgi:hypothetical protein
MFSLVSHDGFGARPDELRACTHPQSDSSSNGLAFAGETNLLRKVVVRALSLRSAVEERHDVVKIRVVRRPCAKDWSRRQELGSRPLEEARHGCLHVYVLFIRVVNLLQA